MTAGTLGGWRLVERLEEGPWGVSWLASGRQTDELVQLHVLPPRFSTPAGREAVERSLARVQELRHPNVRRVLAIGAGGPKPFWVEELRQSASLQSLLEMNRRLLWVPAALVLHEVALALEAAHRVGIAHGSLAADAVQLEQGGVVTVSRFGLAQAAAVADGVGGPGPETDIVAAARLAWEMVAGEPPRPGLHPPHDVALPLSYLELVQSCLGPSAIPPAAPDFVRKVRSIVRGAGIDAVQPALARHFDELSFFFLLTRTFGDTGDGDALVPHEPVPAPPAAAPALFELEGLPTPVSQEFEDLWPDELADEEEEGPVSPGPPVRSVASGSAGAAPGAAPGAAATPPAAFGAQEPAPSPAVAEGTPAAAAPAPAAEPGGLPAGPLLASPVRPKRAAPRAAPRVPLTKLERALAVGTLVAVAAGLVVWASAGSKSDEEIARIARDEVEAYVQTAMQGNSTPVAMPQRVTPSPADLRADVRELVRAGREGEARARLESALLERPGSEADLWLELGRLRLATGDPAAAKEALGRATALDRGLTEGFELLGEVETHLGRPQEAARVWATILDRRGRDPLFLSKLARAWDDAGNVAEAIGVLQALRRIDPVSPQPLLSLGRAYEETRQLDQAAASYAQAADLDPALGEAFWGLIRVLERQGNLKRARREVEKLLARRPDSLEALLYLGQIHYGDRRYEAARDCFQRYLEARPTDWRGLWGVANVDFRQGHYTAAALGYVGVAELRPDDARLAHNLGMAWRLAGDFAEAMEAFQRAMAQDAELWPPRCEAARGSQQRGHYEQAHELYREVVRLNPKHPWARDALQVRLDGAMGDFLLTKICFYPEIFDTLGEDGRL